jgi:glycosyltransferase involved in cell wall biosynthesis
VEDASLGALYRGAHALLMPSSAEGFGFPLLEAMGQGCPVVAGDIGALRELGGDVARYVQPADFDRLAEEAASIPSDGQDRIGIGDACRKQAGLFSPERFSETMSEIYSDWAG